MSDLPIDFSKIAAQADQVASQAQAAQAQHSEVAQPQWCTADGPSVSATAAPSEPLAPDAPGVFPPGFAGRIATYFYLRSYSPVPEVSIASTLALLAGVCGRAYRTYTGKDLSLFQILVARSGIGKDSMHENIPHMVRMNDLPLAANFVRAQDYASGEALHKDVLREPGFLALLGEFGRRLKRMSSPTDSPMQNLRTVMLNAFGKEYMEGKRYSNADNNLDGVPWPCLSVLGETTPGTFLECLTPDMMADGFLSRFLTVTYDGDKPPPNREHRYAAMEEEDWERWKAILSHMIKYQLPYGTPPPCDVRLKPEVQERLENFEYECNVFLNQTDDEAERQVWSRAHLKVIKVASLLAVADNYLFPTVTLAHEVWAEDLVKRDIQTFRLHKQSGNIGTDDNARELKLRALIQEYLRKPLAASYKIPDGMRQASIVPRSYLQVRTARLSAFSNHRQGATRVLDDTLRSMMASGYIQEVKQDKLVDQYGYFGRAFRVLKIP